MTEAAMTSWHSFLQETAEWLLTGLIGWFALSILAGLFLMCILQHLPRDPSDDNP